MVEPWVILIDIFWRRSDRKMDITQDLELRGEHPRLRLRRLTNLEIGRFLKGAREETSVSEVLLCNSAVALYSKVQEIVHLGDDWGSRL